MQIENRNLKIENVQLKTGQACPWSKWYVVSTRTRELWIEKIWREYKVNVVIVVLI